MARRKTRQSDEQIEGSGKLGVSISTPLHTDEPDTNEAGSGDGSSPNSDAVVDSEDDTPEADVDLAPPEKTVKPLTREALAAFNMAQVRSGVIYISRIPPGMQPAKVRHLLSQYGEVGRVYLQQEDVKTAYLRRKYTTTKKRHFIEGWVEFKDKRVARSVAGVLNAQPIGGKKGSRWRDDVWTMKYLPKFKWNMLTEQIAHEAAVHAAKLRVELAQSKSEQREYLKNVELARILDKRNQKRKEKGEGPIELKRRVEDEGRIRTKRQKVADKPAEQLESVLSSIF